jgi:transmembrane sensor
MDDQRRIYHLVEKYFRQTLTEPEKEELVQWIRRAGDDEVLRDVLEHAWFSYEPDVSLEDTASERILAQLFRREPEIATARRRSVGPGLLRWAAAAAILLVAGYGAWQWSHPHKKITHSIETAAAKKDVQPGGNRAVLTLADGSSIALDSMQNGALTHQGGTKIIKLANGQLAYTKAGDSANEVLYNTIATPRGGQYRLQLPDGSMVWLNAASSLRFPTVFSGAARTVELRGEAYFEVAKNARMPFEVSVKGISIAVLGTRFNVNAYDDEAAVRTTLVEGGVSVSRNGQKRVLKPGQQAAVSAGGAITLSSEPHIEEALAWKEGRFLFDGADIAGVMRQLARWYNVEVVYRGGAVTQHFNGGISRNAPLSKVCSMLEATGAAHFTIENDRLIVEP